MPSSTIDPSRFDSIPSCIEAFRNGEFLLVLDDPGRENEGDLIIAAQDVTTEQMGWMIRHSSGYVCVPMPGPRADALSLPPMVTNTQDPRGTAYTVSVDAEHPLTTTGISAHDRALACRVLADPKTTSAHLRRPGHVLPLRSVPGGARARQGHTEAATEFCRLAGKEPVAAIAEIVDDGDEVPGQPIRPGAKMMTGEDCVKFARKWGIKVCTIEDLVAHVEKTEGKLAANGSA